MSTPKDGLHLGDYAIRVVPVQETSDDHDTESSRERARQAEEDAHAAEHSAGPADGEAGRAAAEADVDASIMAAREAASGTAGEAKGGSEVPILLRDPVTGAVIAKE